MKKIFIPLILIITVVFSCKKTDFDNTITGEAIGEFRLTAPVTNTNLVLNSATPNSTVTISWSAAKPGVSTPVKYNWVAALRSGGSLESPILTIPAGNSGLSTSLTLTQKAIDDALTTRGIAAGVKTDFIWSVQADNGTTKNLCVDVFNISITRFADGATPFTLLGPASSTSNVTINPGSTTDSLTFNWTRSLPGNITRPISYRVWFYRDTDPLGTPLFSIISRNAGADTLRRISNKDFSDSLTAAGLTNLATAAGLKWRVAATSGTWSQWSDFTNQLYILREVNIFLVGGATPIGWTPTNALQLSPDNANPGVYFIYVNLTTGNNGFKFLGLKADWGAPGQVEYGNSVGGVSGNNAGDNTGILSSNQGGGSAGNIAVPGAAGVYRIQLNLTTNRYNVVRKGVGIVGAVNGWSAGSPIAMQYIGVNKFTVLQDFTTGNEQFKFHDGIGSPDPWASNYGNSNYWGPLAGLSYTGNTSKLTKPGNNVFENDVTKPVAGRWRVTFDGTDPKNLTYEVTYANVMRIVGDGIAAGPVWDPATSPQMTYLGNGNWTITLNMINGKDFKFVAASAWPNGGANDKYYLDYEDAGAGKIRSDGSNNFKVPGSSSTVVSRTITLNEYTQTYTIN